MSAETIKTAVPHLNLDLYQLIIEFATAPSRVLQTLAFGKHELDTVHFTPTVRDQESLKAKATLCLVNKQFLGVTRNLMMDTVHLVGARDIAGFTNWLLADKDPKKETPLVVNSSLVRSLSLVFLKEEMQRHPDIRQEHEVHSVSQEVVLGKVEEAIYAVLCRVAVLLSKANNLEHLDLSNFATDISNTIDNRVMQMLHKVWMNIPPSVVSLETGDEEESFPRSLNIAGFRATHPHLSHWSTAFHVDRSISDKLFCHLLNGCSSVKATGIGPRFSTNDIPDSVIHLHAGSAPLRAGFCKRPLPSIQSLAFSGGSLGPTGLHRVFQYLKNLSIFTYVVEDGLRDYPTRPYLWKRVNGGSQSLQTVIRHFDYWPKRKVAERDYTPLFGTGSRRSSESLPDDPDHLTLKGADFEDELEGISAALGKELIGLRDRDLFPNMKDISVVLHPYPDDPRIDQRLIVQKAIHGHLSLSFESSGIDVSIYWGKMLSESNWEKIFHDGRLLSSVTFYRQRTGI